MDVQQVVLPCHRVLTAADVTEAARHCQPDRPIEALVHRGTRGYGKKCWWSVRDRLCRVRWQPEHPVGCRRVRRLIVAIEMYEPELIELIRWFVPEEPLDALCVVGLSAFCKCVALVAVVIPPAVTAVGDSAFYGCAQLAAVTIPTSVSEVRPFAFDGCRGLTSLTIPDALTIITSASFCGCSGITSVAIPHMVTSIGDSAFQGCSGLVDVSIPSSVTSICTRAFEGCTGLADVMIPDSVTLIKAAAFRGCAGLTSIALSPRCAVMQRAFDSCSWELVVTKREDCSSGCPT